MTPRLVAALAGGGVIVALALGLYWKGRAEGAAREHARTQAALAQATAARLETRGERESAGRVEVAIRQRELAARAAAELARDALTSEDAHAPLDPTRAARLRAHDERLCDAGSGLAGCPADRNAR